jgi:hypothetical protein
VALEDRPTSAGWYLVAFGLIGTALAIAWTGFNQMVEVVATMQRVEMPGTHEIVLAGGKTTIYYEHESKLRDRHYSSPKDLAFSCALRDQTGKPLALRPSAGKTTYSAAEYAGRNVFDVDIAVPGAYVLTCDGKEPYVVSAAGGIGAWIVVAIVGLLLPGLAGVFVIVFVTIKRRRWHARQRAAAKA